MSTSDTTSIDVEISCCLCTRKHKTSISVPAGWTDFSLHSDSGFCPDHSPIEEWTSAQCPGCVAGWGDCPLWEGFAFERYRHNAHKTLTETDLNKVAVGTCPKRVNGTFGFEGGRAFDVDLSQRAETESGVALVRAIRDYWRKYPKCSPDYHPGERS